jgi:hypothetical protein
VRHSRRLWLSGFLRFVTRGWRSSLDDIYQRLKDQLPGDIHKLDTLLILCSGNAVPLEIKLQSDGCRDSIRCMGTTLIIRGPRSVISKHVQNRQDTNKEADIRPGKVDMFGSYLMRYSLLFTSNTHVHLLDPLLQRHYGGDPWRSWDTEAAP